MSADLVAHAEFTPTTPEVRASLFILRHGMTLAWLGAAVLCPEVRYASIAWRRASRLDRRFARPETWRAILEQYQRGLSPEPLPTDSAIAQLFAVPDVLPLSIAHVRTDPVEAASPAETVTRLDQQLLGAVAAFDAELRLSLERRR